MRAKYRRWKREIDEAAAACRDEVKRERTVERLSTMYRLLGQDKLREAARLVARCDTILGIDLSRELRAWCADPNRVRRELCHRVHGNSGKRAWQHVTAIKQAVGADFGPEATAILQGVMPQRPLN